MGRRSPEEGGLLRRNPRTGLAARPSLAVIPYFCIHDDVLKPGFAQYVTVRVIETMQSVDELRVTAPSSTINLPRNLSIAEIGRRLKVDYLLKGQIIRRGETLHFTQRLYEVATRELILEAETECGLGQLEGFERDILARVIADVRLPLQENEIDRIMSRRPRNSSAYELVIRAQVAMHAMNKRSFAAAKRLLAKAQAIDPAYATTYAWQARYHSVRIGQGWAKEPRAEALEAKRLAEISIKLDPENAVALATAGHLHSYLHRDYVTGERLLRRAVRACPNEPLGWLLLSGTLSYVGKADEARMHAEYALSLSPVDCCLYSFLAFASLCCYCQGDFEQAVSYAEEALELKSTYSTVYKQLAVTLVAMGNVQEARVVAAKLRRLEPGYNFRTASRSLPFKDRSTKQLCLIRLRTAGVFDHDPLGPKKSGQPRVKSHKSPILRR